MTKHRFDLSTKQHHLGRFAAHGEASYLYAKDNLVVVSATGPFNLEFVEDLVAIEMPIVTAMSERFARYYALTTIHNSLLLPPDALKRYAEFRKELTRAGLNPHGLAFVIAPEVEGRLLMVPHFAKLCEESGVKFSAFDDEAGAREWLKEIGYRG